MRIAFIATCCLLVAVADASAAVQVVQIKPQESSRNIRIAVVLEGKPVKGAKVELCSTPGDQSCVSVPTNAAGIAAVHKLAPGNYHVVASSEDEVNADLYLHVAGRLKESLFSIDLTKSYREGLAYWASAQKLPIRDRVQQFQGLIQDPSGANIQGVNIKVLPKGSDGKAGVVGLKTDAEGHFSAQLADGMYVAFFSLQGFRTEIVPFEVTKEGAKNLRIVLQLGSTT